MTDPGTTDLGQGMHRAAERIGEGAAEMARAARSEGRRALDDVKMRAADGADHLARAADAAAEQLDESGNAMISGYGHSLASMMRHFAGGLRERDINDFAAELSRFARGHPAAFLAGSVAVGFGMARVFKTQEGAQIVSRVREELGGGSGATAESGATADRASTAESDLTAERDSTAETDFTAESDSRPDLRQGDLQ